MKKAAKNVSKKATTTKPKALIVPPPPVRADTYEAYVTTPCANCNNAVVLREACSHCGNIHDVTMPLFRKCEPEEDARPASQG